MEYGMLSQIQSLRRALVLLVQYLFTARQRLLIPAAQVKNNEPFPVLS
jgi:hypothetical protein